MRDLREYEGREPQTSQNGNRSEFEHHKARARDGTLYLLEGFCGVVRLSQDREWYGLCSLMSAVKMKGKGIRVMKLNTIPPQDYLEPPGHVKTQTDMQLWARIMMESECPCIHLPRCDPHTFHRIADEQDVSPYLVYMSDKDEADSLRSYWLIRES